MQDAFALRSTRPWEGVCVLPAPASHARVCVCTVSGGPRALAFACSTHGRALAPFFEQAPGLNSTHGRALALYFKQAPGCVRCRVCLR